MVLLAMQFEQLVMVVTLFYCVLLMHRLFIEIWLRVMY